MPDATTPTGGPPAFEIAESSPPAEAAAAGEAIAVSPFILSMMQRLITLEAEASKTRALLLDAKRTSKILVIDNVEAQKEIERLQAKILELEAEVFALEAQLQTPTPDVIIEEPPKVIVEPAVPVDDTAGMQEVAQLKDQITELRRQLQVAETRLAAADVQVGVLNSAFDNNDGVIQEIIDLANAWQDHDTGERAWGIAEYRTQFIRIRSAAQGYQHRG